MDKPIWLTLRQTESVRHFDVHDSERAAFDAANEAAVRLETHVLVFGPLSAIVGSPARKAVVTKRSFAMGEAAATGEARPPPTSFALNTSVGCAKLAVLMPSKPTRSATRSRRFLTSRGPRSGRCCLREPGKVSNLALNGYPKHQKKDFLAAEAFHRKKGDWGE